MKKLLFFFFMLAFFGLSVNAQNNWTGMANFGGTARSKAVSFSIGSKGYVGTGEDNNGLCKDFWEYDPTTNVWTQKADFGGAARMFAVGFSIANKGYVGTGKDANAYNDFWEYNPSTNTWTQKANFIGVARFGAVGFGIGSKGYIGTGTGIGNIYFSDFYEYNPTTNTWTQKANFSGGSRSNAVGFSICDNGYIGTGSNDGVYYKDFWGYNPSNNSWTSKTDFGGTLRDGAVGFSICTYGYIGLGNYVGSTYNDFWEYNPNTNAWIQKTDFASTVRAYSVGFSILGKGYVGSGLNGSNLNDFLKYTPSNTNAPSQPGTITGATTPCSGTTNTYSVSVNPCATSYTWTLPSGWTGTSTTSSITTVASTTSGSISVTANNDCGSSTPRTLVVTVKTIPAQPSTITGNANPCLGSQTYSVTNVTGVTYAWAVSGGGTITGTTNTATANWTTAGTYTVTVTPSNTCGAGTPKTLSVTVVTAPTQPSVITGNTSSCLGSESFSVTNVTGVTYAWAVSGGGTITGTTNTATANWTTAGTYTVSVTPSNACGNGTPRTLSVIVHPNPSTPVIAHNSDTTFCVGDSVRLTSSSATSYLWNTTATTQSITVSTQGIYTVTVTNAYGCSASSLPIHITVNALPIANAGSDLTFCNTDSAMLHASGGVSYAWSPATNLSCINCANPYASPSATTTYTVTVSNANGCTALDSAIVNIVTVLIANAGYDSSICSGENTTLNASGGTGYSWTPITGLNNPNIANPVASPSTTTTYTVNITSGTCSPSSDSVLITINPNPPVPTISLNWLTLMSSSATGNQWYFNGDTIHNATSQFYTVTSATQNGFYTVEVTNSFGCSSISAAFSFTVWGIEENNLSGNFNIYPNPANNNITIENTSLTKTKDEMISIYNFQGQLVLLQPMLQSKININISNFTGGLYYVKVQTESGIAVKKFVKE